MRRALLVLSAVAVLISLLTVVRAPDWVWAWKLAILAGEYGHWLVLLPVALALVAGFALSGAGRIAVLALCAVAAGCLLRPVFSAQRMAATLPQAMQTALGSADAPALAIDGRRLYLGSRTSAGEVVTEVFSRPGGEDLKLDFYRPLRALVERYPDRGPAPPPPCIIVIHGGGWDRGDRGQLPELNGRLAALGYAVAAIDYRLAPRWQWPAPKEDTLAAIAWLKGNSDRLGLDPSRLVLLGRSAGAQIAEVVGYTAHDPALRGVISFYGPSDMVFGYRSADEDDAIRSPALMRAYLGGTPEQQPARYADASALRFVTRGSPPTLMLHGYLDTLAWHRHDERLAARLTAEGVPHYYLRLPWATHGFDYNLDGPGGQLADYAIKVFLAKVTAPPRQ